MTAGMSGTDFRFGAPARRQVIARQKAQRRISRGEHSPETDSTSRDKTSHAANRVQRQLGGTCRTADGLRGPASARDRNRKRSSLGAPLCGPPIWRGDRGHRATR
jgi:hypothetical protein